MYFRIQYVFSLATRMYYFVSKVVAACCLGLDLDNMYGSLFPPSEPVSIYSKRLDLHTVCVFMVFVCIFVVDTVIYVVVVVVISVSVHVVDTFVFNKSCI